MGGTPYLSFDYGPDGPMRLVIPDGDHVLGRSPEVEFRVNEAFISGHHARLSWRDDALTVTDLGSTNGTKVNGSAVAGVAGLSDGDVIRFGSLEATVHLPGSRLADQTAVLDLTDPAPPPPSPPPPGPPGPSGPPPPTGPPPSSDPTPSPSTGVDGRRVFISYASEDAALADEIYRHLERIGWDVWRDEVALSGGENWSSAITEGLRTTRAVVVLMTEHSMTSKWVRREIRAADRAGIPILPIRVDGTPIPDELALLLNEIHHIDITRPSGDKDNRQYLRRIEDDLLALARRPGGRRSDRGRARILIGKVLGAIGMLGVVLGFGMFFYFAYLAITANSDLGISRPVADRDQDFLRVAAAFPVIFVSMIIAAIGQALQQSGKRMQI